MGSLVLGGFAVWVLLYVWLTVWWFPAIGCGFCWRLVFGFRVVVAGVVCCSGFALRVFGFGG